MNKLFPIFLLLPLAVYAEPPKIVLQLIMRRCSMPARKARKLIFQTTN